MSNGKLVYSQLLDFLDRNHFNYLVRKYDGDKYVKNSGIHVESYSVSGEKIHLQLRMQQRNYLDSLKNLISHLEGFKIEDLS